MLKKITITLEPSLREYLSKVMLKNRNKLRNKKLNGRLNAKEISDMISAGQILTKLNFNQINFRN